MNGGISPSPNAVGAYAGRILIIINPQAGQESVAALRRKLGGAFAARKVNFDIVPTRRAGHATELAREAAELGYKRVCVVGGDGSIAEVATGLVGMTFAAGWTPCAGPILGAILTLALSQGDAGQAAGLLSVYSVGLAIPFLIIAVAGASTNSLGWIAARSASAATVAGAVMLAVGIIMILGIYQQIFARIVAVAPWAPIEPAIS